MLTTSLGPSPRTGKGSLCHVLVLPSFVSLSLFQCCRRKSPFKNKPIVQKFFLQQRNQITLCCTFTSKRFSVKGNLFGYFCNHLAALLSSRRPDFCLPPDLHLKRRPTEKQRFHPLCLSVSLACCLPPSLVMQQRKPFLPRQDVNYALRPNLEHGREEEGGGELGFVVICDGGKPHTGICQ